MGLQEDRPSNRTAYEARVLRPNRREARLVATAVRAKYGNLVIDPTHLKVSGWSQANYHAFWTTVLERYVGRVIFADGWQFSIGCSVEFLSAVRLGAQTLNQNFAPIETTDAMRLLRSANFDIKVMGFDITTMEEVANKLATVDCNRRRVADKTSGEG
jgi:hypothetical protein